MTRRLEGLILLIAILLVYVIHPYYSVVPGLVYNIAWYIVGVLGAWISLKLIIR